MATTSYEGFVTHCTKFSALWRSVRFGVLAANGSKGHQLLGLHATFGNYALEEPLTDSLTGLPGEPSAIRGVMSAHDFMSIIREMDKGEFRIGGRNIGCAHFSSPDQLFLRATGQEYLRSPDLTKQWSKRWPSLFLRKYGPDVTSLGFDEISLNTQLQRGKYSFPGLFYFSLEKIGFPVGGARSTQVELLAPIYVSLSANMFPSQLGIQVDADTSIRPDSFFAKVWHGAYREGINEVVEFGDARVLQTAQAEGRPLRTLGKTISVPELLGQALVLLILEGEEMDFCSPSIQMKPAPARSEEKTWVELVTEGEDEGTQDICFVFMALNGQMKRIFKEVFEPVASDFCLIAEHSDMLPSPVVVPEIIKKIHGAKVIIADITRHRPNVYYEIGFSHKVNPLKVIIIGQERYEELPSDIDQQSIRYIQYEDDDEGLADLKIQLRKRIQYCLDQRGSHTSG